MDEPRGPEVSRAPTRSGLDVLSALRPRLGAVLRRTPLRRRGPWSDDAFVQRAFLEVLGRPVDATGRAHFVAQLRAGHTRAAFLEQLRTSDEARTRASRPSLPSLRAQRPSHYRHVRTDDGVRVPVYRARDDADLAWLEDGVLANGYYERGGDWSLEDNDDKRAMAELVAGFGPSSVLEIGCSSGAVLGHLVRRGIDARGIDISESARRQASDAIRDRILLGDLTELDLHATFDVVLALDVLEHVRPDRVAALLAGAVRHLAPDGLVITNIPAYGRDPVFGEPFPMYIAEWRADAEKGRPFRDVLVDADGYPLHGHLVWATPRWWEERFAEVGLSRADDLERQVQERFADHFAALPARRSMFVLRRSPGISSPR